MTRRGMLMALSAMLPLAVAGNGSVSHRTVNGPEDNPDDPRGRVRLARITASPKPERREMSDEERAQLKTDRKARRADRMRLRKRRGFR